MKTAVLLVVHRFVAQQFGLLELRFEDVLLIPLPNPVAGFRDLGDLVQ